MCGKHWKLFEGKNACVIAFLANDSWNKTYQGFSTESPREPLERLGRAAEQRGGMKTDDGSLPGLINECRVYMRGCEDQRDIMAAHSSHTHVTLVIYEQPAACVEFGLCIPEQETDITLISCSRLCLFGMMKPKCADNTGCM